MFRQQPLPLLDQPDGFLSPLQCPFTGALGSAWLPLVEVLERPLILFKFLLHTSSPLLLEVNSSFFPSRWNHGIAKLAKLTLSRYAHSLSFRVTIPVPSSMQSVSQCNQFGWAEVPQQQGLDLYYSFKNHNCIPSLSVSFVHITASICIWNSLLLLEDGPVDQFC